MPIHYQRTYSVAFLFLAVISMGSYSWAGEIKGKVDTVLRDTLFIKFDSNIVPNVGDKVEVIYSTEQGDAAPIGIWRVSKIRKNSVIARKIEAAGAAVAGMDAIIFSSNAVSPVVLEKKQIPAVPLKTETPVETARYTPPAALKTRGGRLGVEIQDMTQDLRGFFNISPETQGVLVKSVIEGSAAQKAGLEIGDVITIFNGETLQNVSSLVSMISVLSPGTKVNLKVIRKGWERDFSITLDAASGRDVPLPLAPTLPTQSYQSSPPIQAPAVPHRGGYGRQMRQEQDAKNRKAAGELLVDLLKLRKQAMQSMNK